MTGLLESLAYAITRGAVRAWLDVLRERSTAVEETPEAADRARAARLRAAVELLPTEDRGPAGPEHSAPGGG